LLEVRTAVPRSVRWSVLAVAFAVVAPAVVRAQQYNFTRYTAAEGLPSSHVLSIAQDATGYLWFGTDSGIARYDGTDFEPIAGAPGVPGSQVTALAAVDDVIVYATLEGGAGVIDAGGRRPLLGDGLDGIIHDIVHDPGGGLLLATSRGVVAYRGDSSERLSTLANVPDGCCRAVLRDRRGRIWAGGSGGIYRLNNREYVRGARGLPADAAVNVLLEDSRGRLWVGGSAGLYRQEGDRFVRVETGNLYGVLSAAVAGTELWFGTTSGALRVRGDRVDWVGPAAGLGGGRVNRIVVDHEGNVWFATDSGAVKWVSAAFVAFSREHGLSDDFVVDIAGGAERVLVATRSGVVSVDPLNHVRTEFEVEPGTAARVNAVASIGQRMFVGTDGGLIVRDARGTTARTIAGPGVRSVLPRGDEVWLGTVAGLRRLQGNRMVAVPGAEALAGVEIVDLALDGEDRLWMALGNGAVWTEQAGRFQRVPLALDGDPIEAVDLASADSGVWIASRGQGAWRVRADGSASRLTRAGNGLASDFVRSVVVGPHDGVWLCTNRGVDHWRSDQGITHYGLADGLVSLGCTPGAAAIGPAGTVWFGSPEGLTADARSDISVRPLPPVVVIRSVVAGGAEASSDELRGLSPERSDVHIAYSALSYRDAESTRFQYRLLGRTDLWSRPTDERRVSYPGLAPGDYVFEVQAIGDQGLWSVDSARVRFTVLPRPWQTVWFRGSISLLTLGLVGLLFWRRLRLVDGERQQLRLMVDKRTRALVEKNALLERMATTDELTGLPNRRFFLDSLQRELRKLTRIATDQQLSLLVIDLDRFKSVNDRYGHVTGDAVLRHVAGRLAHAVRASDLPARYGGEEFAILLPDTGAEGAEFLAEKLRADVESSSVRYEGATIPVTISVGVATIDAPTRYGPEIEDDLIRRADEAMYQAKTGGRNRVVIASRD